MELGEYDERRRLLYHPQFYLKKTPEHVEMRRQADTYNGTRGKASVPMTEEGNLFLMMDRHGRDISDSADPTAISAIAERFLSEQDFLREAINVSNSVYLPSWCRRGRYRCVKKIRVGYFSLAAMIWELFEHYDLLDIYTHYCTCKVFTKHAAHSTARDTDRKLAAILRKRGTGYWGFSGEAESS